VQALLLKAAKRAAEIDLGEASGRARQERKTQRDAREQRGMSSEKPAR